MVLFCIVEDNKIPTAQHKKKKKSNLIGSCWPASRGFGYIVMYNTCTASIEYGKRSPQYFTKGNKFHLYGIIIVVMWLQPTLAQM